MVIELITLIGWLGVLCCTTAYVLISLRLLKTETWLYQALNSIGGTFLVLSAVFNHDMPNMVANGLWAVIGLISLGRLLFPSNASKQSTDLR